MQLTRSHLDAFLADGLVLIDDALDDATLTAASEAFDHLYSTGERDDGIVQYFDEPGLHDVMQHPALEAIAKHMLGADEVVLNSAACLQKKPSGGDEWTAEGEHVDIQFSVEEMAATPRRMLAMVMVFVEDLPERRGNTLVRLGSHRQIAQWLAQQNPPREPIKAQPTHKPDLPDLPYADLTPVVAKRGQVAAFTTALIHCGSSNVDSAARKIMFVNFCPKGMMKLCSPNHKLREQRTAWRDTLREAFRPERRHLLDDNE